MKKLQILSIILLFIFNSCVSTKKSELKDKRIYGNALVENEKYFGDAFEPDSIKMVIEKANGFKVYLTKKKERKFNHKLFYQSKNSSFDFIIPANEIKKNKYILFENVDHFKYVKISSITGELKDLLIDYHPILIAKPAIYLYPTIEQEITIKHDFKGQILNTYPEYIDMWKIIAKPNGEIQNIADKRIYNYLFWDGTYNFSNEHYNFKTGFEVRKSELINFLQEKLATIGLNNTEINDFIVYWLPLLNKSEYNFIHFRINDNIDNISFLNIEPKPDTEIRVFMEFKGIEKKGNITEQKLETIERKGFTLIEWGGAKIGHKIIE